MSDEVEFHIIKDHWPIENKFSLEPVEVDNTGHMPTVIDLALVDQNEGKTELPTADNPE
jgi:hypothetical protein